MVSAGSGGRGLQASWPRTAVGADTDMGGAYRFPYGGILVPTGSLACMGGARGFQNRGKFLCGCMQLDCRSVIFAR